MKRYSKRSTNVLMITLYQLGWAIVGVAATAWAADQIVDISIPLLVCGGIFGTIFGIFFDTFAYFWYREPENVSVLDLIGDVLRSSPANLPEDQANRR
jgi:hypothetical protein